MTLLAANAAHWLDEALKHEYGIILHVHVDGAVGSVIGPSTRAKQVFYRFRSELGNPEYKNVQIRLSPTDPANEIWLINQGSADAELPPEPLSSQESF